MEKSDHAEKVILSRTEIVLLKSITALNTQVQTVFVPNAIHFTIWELEENAFQHPLQFVLSPHQQEIFAQSALQIIL
jgi:hypothetical protein